MTVKQRIYDHKRLCAALASQDRMDILLTLKDGSLCVSELCAKLGREQTAVSHDLQHLEYANFVRVRREGKFRHYSLNKEFAEPFLHAVAPDRATAAKQAGDFRSIIDQAPLSMAVICRDGYILFLGGGISDQGGKGHGFYIGKRIDDILESMPELAARFREALAADGPTKWTYDSAGRTHETVTRAYFDDAGGKAGIVCVTYDVSQRLTDEKLRAIGESEKVWRMLVQGSPDVITQIDASGSILSINHPFHGLDRSAVVGSSLYGYIESASRPMAMEQIGRAFGTGRHCAFEAAAASRTEGTARYECRVVPYWKEGKIIAVTLTMRDLTPPSMTS
ncbi:MAG TPA: metalloregulator ArsR/SmtB family transcription factor [Candidatus Binatia bacterium]|nr:metalloregulator ArsR/SmtB family transcription factor [Candidatus Binatia bacterium]